MRTEETNRIDREELPDAGRMLADWGAVARKLGRVPGCEAYEAEGKYRAMTLARCFGSWLKVGRAFMEFAAYKPEWADVVELSAEFVAAGRRRPRRARRRWMRDGNCGHSTVVAHGAEEGMKRGDRPVCGEPINLPAVRHAPVNEAGVVLLFGAMAERLGFCIEAARTAFPDCEAKRRVGPGEWQTVRIEFEYESRNFQLHGHAVEGCDMIVCWRHNWPECPEKLEVISLSDEIERMGRK